MPKKQHTTYADINYAIEAIISILKEITYEECENILNQAYSARARENDLDVDISESESRDSPFSPIILRFICSLVKSRITFLRISRYLALLYASVDGCI